MKILNRAKSIHSDYYPIGEWIEYQGKCFIIETEQLIGFEVNAHSEPFKDGMLDGEISIQDFIYEVEKETRSLNFEDMLDSEGDKIFASLDWKTCKGADILKAAPEELYYKHSGREMMFAYFDGTLKQFFWFDNKIQFCNTKYNYKKVVGIQK